MAESISINTKFTKVKSPYIGESLLKLMCILDFITFNVSSEKVRCSTCDVYILKSRMIGHVGKHLALNEIAPHKYLLRDEEIQNMIQLNQVALNFLRTLVYI